MGRKTVFWLGASVFSCLGTTRCQSYADDSTVIRTLYTGPASPYKTPPKKIATGETIYVEPIGAPPARARAVLEKAAYLKVMKYVDQEKFGYILTNAGVKRAGCKPAWIQWSRICSREGLRRRQCRRSWRIWT
jgi:hypothetical protein